MKRLVSLVLVLIVMSCSFSINAQLDTGLYECGHDHEITDGNCGNSTEASFKCEDCLLTGNDLKDLPPITTLDGTNVEYDQKEYEEYTAAENLLKLREYLKRHKEIDQDDLVAIGYATLRYNCHAYAWYSQDTHIYCWIDYPTAYVNDAHTKSVAWSNLRVGDRIVYYVNGVAAHSAIVISLSGGVRVASKWGGLHLFEHSYDNVTSIYVDPDGLDCRAYRYPSWHTFGAWTNYSSSQHKRKCTYCDATEFGAHILSNWTSSGPYSHKRTCGTCNRIESEEHKYPSSWSNNGTQNHIKHCSRCGRTLTSSHTFSHWQSAGTSGHRRQCTACGRSELQAHTYNGIACTVCGYDGPGVAPIICFGFEAFFTPKRKFTATNYIES